VASIVVVGGGVAGLACAWKLRRAGHEVEVLESAAEPGGRMRTEACGEFRLERGAQLVGGGYRNLRAAADALGLGPRLRPVADAAEAVLHDGRLHRIAAGAPWWLLAPGLLSGPARRRLLRLPLALWRHRRRLDPLRPEVARALDGEDLATALRRTVGDEAFERLLAPLVSSSFDCEPEELSHAAGLLALRLLGSGAGLASFEGGNGLFTRALAAPLTVRCGCQVVDVETETAGARVRYRTQGRERSVLADAAVVALPGSTVAGVCAKLTPEERGFFEGVRYGRGTIVHLLLERPPAGLPPLGVSFPRRAGLDLHGLAVAHPRPGLAPAGAGLVNAALTERAATRLWQAPDGEVVEFVREQLARTPVGPLSPLRGVVHRWPALLPRFGPGALGRLGRFLGRIERSPRLAFAGDYLVGSSVEGALTSGMRAATEIARAP
jgi:oxygen-dependent protoporphyrinogen oxidase